MTAVIDRTADLPPAAPDPTPAEAPWRTRILPPLSGRSAALGGWLVTLLVAAVGGALRFVRLDEPVGRIFDEVYYACDAQNLLRAGVELGSLESTAEAPAEPCTPNGTGAFIVHPPLGKWAIALGLRAFGTNELGWRFSAAVAGTLTILVLVRVARRMTGSTYLGALAGLLLSLDGLHFVQSRIAMLDVFVVLWVVVAFACLVADRDAVRRRLAATPDEALRGWGPRLGLRPWLLAGGVALGAAVATKWSALYYVAALGLLALSWEVGARRTAGVRAPFRATLVRSSGALIGLLLVLPTVLYTLSWAGWFLSEEGYDRQWADTNPGSGLTGLLPDGLRSWADYHRQIYGFHDTLESSHPYQSHPWGWLVLARPVSYYYPSGLTGCGADSCSSEVLALGNPALWWASVPVLALLLFRWVARRDWRAAAVLVLFTVGIAPWILDDLDDRTMFAFYALPSAPFLALGIALLAGWALGGPGASPRRRALGATAVGVHLSLVAMMFIYFYPVLAAVLLPYEAWLDRMWFSSWI